jgi:hypothetical protein
LKKAIFFWVLFFTWGWLFFGCSTQKNKMLNRGYHALNTKYNVLFNGQEAFAVGQAILEQAHDDNFFELLEVEPIALNGERMDQTTVVPGFARAEEKAVKAIQKHSMNIEGIQRNNKIDEAYLLLGKARYFDRRFFPALEAFNFLLENYADRKTYVEGRIWREKTNIRLRNDQLAIKNLRSLARSITPRSRFHSLANATLSQAFINTQQLDSACYYIRKAAVTAKNNHDKGRYYFIAGQLFETLQKSDSALWAFEQVAGLKRKTLRTYWINAQIKRLQIRSIRDSLDPVTSYQKLLDNYENSRFDHQINRALGLHYFQQNQDSLGQDYLNRSLRSNHLDLPTKQANYRDLANFNFATGGYLLTGAFLDSLLTTLPEETLIKRRTQRERDNLNGVIKYEKILSETDSILHLTSLDKTQQMEYFERFLQEKQSQALAQVPTEEKSFFPFFGKSANAFYFYNPKLVVQGQQKFLSTWGDRPNTDNWAIASRIAPIGNNVDQVQEKSPESQETFFVEKAENYVNKIPRDPAVIDSLQRRNQNAYLQVGMIYKESFKNFAQAQDRLQHLLTLNPAPELAAPALYHLFKIHEKTEPQTAKKYFDRIIADYPQTAYGKILGNTEEFDQSKLNTPENVYKNLLDSYSRGEYDLLLDKAQSLRVFISGTTVQPKFDLLMANIQGRLQGRSAWQTALQEVATKYPQTPEAEKAQQMIAQIILTDSIDLQNKTYLNYKWIFTFNIRDSIGLKDTKTKLQNALEEEPKTSWFLSEDRFDKDQIYLVLHGIRNPRNLNEWKKKFVQDGQEILKLNNFVVLSSDYKKMLRDKKTRNPEDP